MYGKDKKTQHVATNDTIVRFKGHTYKGHDNRRAKKVKKMTGLTPSEVLALANPKLK